MNEQEIMSVMTKIMDGRMAEDDIAAFLTELAQRGETAEEISGAAKVLRAKAETIQSPPGAIDCCGTGGDMTGTYNISTAVALVSAACGVPVAKHGNRASSSKSGAADVLEKLGVNLDIPKEKLEQALRELNFCFLMAPNHHKAMKNVSAVRKKLGTKTIFNLLGPLANPAGTKLQLVGVYDKKWLTPMAEALRNLGAQRAWVVHGSDGLDEITVTGPTDIVMLDNGKITQKKISPADFGLPVSKAEDLKGGDASVNAAALEKLLAGEKSAYRDITVANTAAVLCINDPKKDLKGAAQIAMTAIDKGLALKTLNDYIEFTKS